MDEKKPESAWDELVEDLGVDADPASTERHQPQSAELPSAVRSTDVAPPKSQPSDWNALAGSLGLEATAPSPAAHQSEPQQSEPSAPEPVADERAAEEESVEATQDSSNESLDDLPELRSEFDKELIEDTGDSEPQDSQETEDPNIGISGEEARTAFDSLFSESTTNWGLPSSADNILDTPLEFSHSEEEPAAETSEAESETTDQETTDQETTERPKRRRSRRRRGRGGRKAEAKTQEESTQGEAADANELDVTVEPSDQESSKSEDGKDEKPRRRRSRRRGRRKKSETSEETPVDRSSPEEPPKAELYTGDDQDDQDDQDDDDDDSDEGPSTRQRGGHRNLPTWSEAIGGIVDSNLESRSKSPSKPSSSRGRDRGRGRRKKPT
jgi:hypothetical protein